MWRYRRAWFNPALRVDNTAAGTGEVDMAKSHGDANTAKGVGDKGQEAHTDYETPPSGSTPGVIAGQINHAPNLITSILAPTTNTPVTGFVAGDEKKMQPRKMLVCLADGTSAYVIGHFTAPFTSA
jgi:hypothetical protein